MDANQAADLQSVVDILDAFLKGWRPFERSWVVPEPPIDWAIYTGEPSELDDPCGYPKGTRTGTPELWLVKELPGHLTEAAAILQSIPNREEWIDDVANEIREPRDHLTAGRYTLVNPGLLEARKRQLEDAFARAGVGVAQQIAPDLPPSTDYPEGPEPDARDRDSETPTDDTQDVITPLDKQPTAPEKTAAESSGHTGTQQTPRATLTEGKPTEGESMGDDPSNTPSNSQPPAHGQTVPVWSQHCPGFSGASLIPNSSRTCARGALVL